MNNETFLEKQCRWANETAGKLHEKDGHFCEKCRNKGLIFFPREGEMVARKCVCVAVRKNLRIIANSGLESVLKEKTFDSFLVTENWQKSIKDKALSFLQNDLFKTFFIGGQCGSGKTHLCTAMCGELIKANKPTIYLLWTKVSRELKALANETAFNTEIEQYKSTEVLYIDDFLKVMNGAKPTPADINIAFEILNSRLFDQDKITIISSEFTIDELLSLDEGTASRICERSGPFALSIGRSTQKNYRLRQK